MPSARAASCGRPRHSPSTASRPRPGRVGRRRPRRGVGALHDRATHRGRRPAPPVDRAGPAHRRPAGAPCLVAHERVLRGEAIEPATVAGLPTSSTCPTTSHRGSRPRPRHVPRRRRRVPGSADVRRLSRSTCPPTSAPAGVRRRRRAGRASARRAVDRGLRRSAERRRRRGRRAGAALQALGVRAARAGARPRPPPCRGWRGPVPAVALRPPPGRRRRPLRRALAPRRARRPARRLAPRARRARRGRRPPALVVVGRPRARHRLAAAARGRRPGRGPGLGHQRAGCRDGPSPRAPRPLHLQPGRSPDAGPDRPPRRSWTPYPRADVTPGRAARRGGRRARRLVGDRPGDAADATTVR